MLEWSTSKTPLLLTGGSETEPYGATATNEVYFKDFILSGNFPIQSNPVTREGNTDVPGNSLATLPGTDNQKHLATNQEFVECQVQV